MQKALIAGQKLLYQGGDQPRFSNGATMLTEMHFVASPPALEESPGDGGASKRPSGLWVLSAGGKYRAAGSYRKDSCVEQVSVSCTWYVVLCQPERGNFKNPQFQPHIFFSSRRKENVPLTVQETRAAQGIAIPQDPQGTGECSADHSVHQTTLSPEHCRAMLAWYKKRARDPEKYIFHFPHSQNGPFVV